MNTRNWLAWSVLSLVFAPAVWASGETLESVEKKILGRWDKLKTMSAKMTMDMSMPSGMGDMSMKAEGTVEYMRRDDKELFRMETVTQPYMSGEKMESMSSRMSTVYDGAFAYTVMDMMGQKRAMKTVPDTVMGSPGGRRMFADLHKNNTLKLLPDAKAAGEAVYVIEAKPNNPIKGGLARAARIKLFFAKASGILVKLVGLTETSEEIMAMAFSDIKINPTISADRFVFEAPADVEVVDMTRKGPAATGGGG